MPDLRTSSPERVLDMLLQFGGSEPALSVRALARRFGTSRSATYRYLQMLRRRDLIEEGPVAGSWRAGPRLLHFARTAVTQRDLVTVAEPVVRRLAFETGETVLLTRRVGDRAVCVACAESPQPIRISFEPARDTPLHAGSAARVHLAHLDGEMLDRLLARPLERLTAKTPRDAGQLRREVALIRRRGWATSEGEVDIGVRSVSAPVLNRDGRMLAALTLAGPSFRIPKTRLRTLAPRVVDAAQRVATRVDDDAAPPVEPALGPAAAIRFIRM